MSINDDGWSLVGQSDSDWSVVTDNKEQVLNNEKRRDTSSHSTGISSLLVGDSHAPEIPSDVLLALDAMSLDSPVVADESTSRTSSPEETSEILPYWEDDYSSRKFHPRKTGGGKRCLKHSLVKRAGNPWNQETYDDHIFAELPREKWDPLCWVWSKEYEAVLDRLVRKAISAAKTTQPVDVDWQEISRAMTPHMVGEVGQIPSPESCRRRWRRLNLTFETVVDDWFPGLTARSCSQCATLGRSRRWGQATVLFEHMEKAGVATRIPNPQGTYRQGTGLGRYSDPPVEEVCYRVRVKNPLPIKRECEEEDCVVYRLRRYRSRHNGKDDAWRRYAVKEDPGVSRFMWYGDDSRRNTKRERRKARDFSSRCMKSYNAMFN